MPKIEEQQEIEHYEQELKALLVRVLKEPLLPLSQTLDGLVGRVEELEEQVVQHLSGMLAGIGEDVERRIRRLELSIAEQADRQGKKFEESFEFLQDGLRTRNEALLQEMHASHRLIETNLDQRLKQLETALNVVEAAHITADQAQTEWRTRQEEWQKISSDQAEVQTQAALRPLRNLLIGTLFLAGASLLGLAAVGARIFH